MKHRKPLSSTSEWDIPLLQQYDVEIARLAKDFGLDTYPNQLEIISSNQMMDAYAGSGMPIGYHHWSFGKHFLDVEKRYRRGQMGLAYEIVINSNPCIAYLMEENSVAMQALVIAHACYGHNSFFKNNYLFQTWTQADAIIDYLLFARSYITECEQRHGIETVECFIDSCHCLQYYGVDRYKRPAPNSLNDEKIRQQNRERYLQSHVNELWCTIPESENMNTQKKQSSRFPKEPQENILYFLEKNSPNLEPWEREIIRIIRKLAQYFYPQRQTQVMNEGWACFWHYTLLNALYDERLVTDEFMLEVLQSHTDVIYQPPFDSQFYTGINPYTLGYNMMQDIKRIATNPTTEDKLWFPDIANRDWFTVMDFAMRNFKDESFIAQYLSPNMIRELKLFSVQDDDQEPHLSISAIHDEDGYQYLRTQLSKQYNLGFNEPNIQIFNVDINGDRSLTLRHYQQDRRPLADTTSEVLKHIHRLWGFPVKIETVTEDEQITHVWQCPEQDPPSLYA